MTYQNPGKLNVPQVFIKIINSTVAELRKYTTVFEKVPKKSRKKLLKIAPPSLSWWGGEPFMNFDLIVKSKKYFEELSWNEYGIELSDLVYSVVTNLTIMNVIL